MILGVGCLQAAELAWDTDPASGIQGGPADWNTTAANWTTDGGASNTPWDNAANAGDTAVFTTGTGRVSLTEDIDLAGITLTTDDSSTIGGRSNMTYVIEGEGGMNFSSRTGAIDVTGSGIRNTQINSNLTGTGGLVVDSVGAGSGDGRLVFIGDNSGLSGGITVNSGLFAFSSSENLGNNQVTLDGGGLFGPANHSGPAGTQIAPEGSVELDQDLVVAGSGSVIRVWGGRTILLSGALSGAADFDKTDGGTLIVAGDNSGFSGTLNQLNGTTTIDSPFPGGLDFTAGILNLGPDGVIGGSLSTIGSSGTLNIEGTIDGDLSVGDDVSTTLFGAGSITGNLNTGSSGASEIELTLAGGTFAVDGDVNVTGTLTLASDGLVGPGSPILTFSALNTPSVDPADDIQIAGLDDIRNGSATFDPTQITITGSPASLAWTGAGGGTWDVNTTQSWQSGGSPETFFNFDSVSFGNAATTSSVNIESGVIAGDVTVASTDVDYTFTGGGIGGPGVFTKSGDSALTFNQAAGNDLAGGFQLDAGSVSISSNQQATGTGPLSITDATLANFAPAFEATFTVTYANETIALENAQWNFGGEGSQNVHTYNFTGGETGSESATDPAGAIQITDSTLAFSSTRNTTKAFNGRVNWSGSNFISRSGNEFTQNTNWNRAWYGTGTVTIDHTGGATGRTMSFNGGESTFSGVVDLNASEPAGGSDPTFQLNEPLPADFDVRTRWQLENNAVGGLDNSSRIRLFGDQSGLVLNEPIDNADLTVELDAATLVLSDAPSTVGSLSATDATIEASGDDSALTITAASGSGFSGTLDLREGGSVGINADGLVIGEQTMGPLTRNSGEITLIVDAASPENITIDGDFVQDGSVIRLQLVGLPPAGTPVTILGYDSLTGPEPMVVVENFPSETRLGTATNVTATGITLTLTGDPKTLLWTGDISDEWDTNQSQNWSLNGSPSVFLSLDNALFDDSTSFPDVFVGAEQIVGNVTFDNDTLDFNVESFVDLGINGSGSLVKSGGATTSISGTHQFSLGTVLNAGRLALNGEEVLGTTPLTVNGGAISSDGTASLTLPNPLVVEGSGIFGDESDSGDITLTGPITGSGSLTTAGPGTLTLAPAEDNPFAGDLIVADGVTAVGTNTAAGGTGSLLVTGGASFQGFPIAGTGTTAFAHSAITIDAATLTLGGSSPAVSTHTYEFTGGEIGDPEASDPATAIQVIDGTLSLPSTFNTTKVLDARINWSGSNTINRPSSNFSQFTNWNGSWYGTGEITVNQTGTATSRAMRINGTDNSFTGSIILNASEPAGGEDPRFEINQPLGATSYEVRNRWDLVNNAASGGLGNAETITLVGSAARLTFNQPVTNTGLAVTVATNGVINVSSGTSVVGTLTVGGVEQPAATYTNTSPFIAGDGELIVLGSTTAGGYENWLASFGLTPADANTGKFESFDGSGVTNIVQFALGGDPTDPSNNGLREGFATDANEGDALVLTIAVRNGATFGGSPAPTAAIEGVRYAIEGSDDLADWTAAVEEITPVQDGGGALVAPSGYTLKSFRLVESPALDTLGFLRVKVEDQ